MKNTCIALCFIFSFTSTSWGQSFYDLTLRDIVNLKQTCTADDSVFPRFARKRQELITWLEKTQGVKYQEAWDPTPVHRIRNIGQRYVRELFELYALALEEVHFRESLEIKVGNVYATLDLNARPLKKKAEGFKAIIGNEAYQRIVSNVQEAEESSADATNILQSTCSPQAASDASRKLDEAQWHIDQANQNLPPILTRKGEEA